MLLLALALPAEAQFFPSAKRRPDPGPQPKNITGKVTDSKGTPIAGARVFVRDMKSKVVRTLMTDQEGVYRINALPHSIDYEVWAEHQGKASDKRYVSGLLARADNNLSFQLDVTVNAASGASPPVGDSASTVDMLTYDLVRLHGSFEYPTGVPAPIPGVLLLHGYGEDRTVWDPLKRQLLSRGYAVMTVDLRGHGDSRTRNARPLDAIASWRTNHLEFPLDLDPALDWLKSRPRIDSDRIIIIGFDVGANLALLAAGRFPQVRTVVAINPQLNEALALAGAAQEFRPKSSLLVVKESSQAEGFRAYLKPPFLVKAVAVEGGTPQWIANTDVVTAIVDWLRTTY